MAVKIGSGVVGVAAVVAATAWLMGWPLERAVYLAPLLVVCVLAVAGLFLFWGKVAWTQLQESGRPRFWLGVWAAGIAFVVLLTVLGINLPRE